jgi:hypothetical protein
VDSQQFDKLVDRESSVTNEGSQSAYRELLVLWDRKVDTKASLRHDEVTSDLADGLPTCLLEGFDSFGA